MGFIGDAVSGVMGMGKGYDKSAKSMREIEELYGGIDIPDYSEIEEALKEQIISGAITPQEATAILQDPSRLESFQVDPRLREAQYRALGELQSIGDAGGLRLSDKAQLQEIAMDEAAKERGAREAIEAKARATGTGGSGLELASKLISQQGGAGRRSRRGTEVAALAQDRALNAILNAGNLAGGIRGQAFGEEAAKAKAADEIARFNAEMRNRVQDANLARRERSDYANRDYKMGIYDRLGDYKGKRFGHEMDIAGGKSGAIRDRAGIEAEKGRSRDEFTGGLFETGADMAAMGAMGMFSDVNLKENVEGAEPEVDDFLSNLSVNEFEYKDKEKFGEGKHYGPMAQDLEKSKVGRTMVEDTPDGKMIDYGKGQGVMLAILKNLSDRLEEVEGAK
jgi:hypothetical protein